MLRGRRVPRQLGARALRAGARRRERGRIVEQPRTASVNASTSPAGTTRPAP